MAFLPRCFWNRFIQKNDLQFSSVFLGNKSEHFMTSTQDKKKENVDKTTLNDER